MQIIAVTGRKGGIGKSTISANLAIEMLDMGYSVRLLDLDPQHSLKAWAGLGSGVLAELVEAVDASTQHKFQKAIEASTADRMIIDTPPGFADQALMAALVADVVLLPSGPSPLDIMAAADALNLAKEAKKERGGRKPRIYFVPSKVTNNTRMGKELPAALLDLGAPVLPGITQRAIVAEATLAGLTVREHSRSSESTQEFRKLADTLDGA